MGAARRAVPGAVREAAARIVAEVTAGEGGAEGGRWLILGVGNPDSGADRLGRQVAAEVAREVALRSGRRPPSRPSPGAEGARMGRGAPGVVEREVEAGLAAGAHLEVRVSSGSAFDILDAWDGHDRVILVDACRGGGPPGSLHRFDAAAGPLPVALGSTSSHGFGVAEAVELARALGRLPRELVVWGLEAAP